MDSSEHHDLEPGLRIRVVSGVYFCATKLEAFRGRGKGDYMSSRDLDDLVAVIDGRAELVEEMKSAPADVREYIALEISKRGIHLTQLPLSVVVRHSLRQVSSARN